MSRTVSKALSNIVTDVRTCYDEIALNDSNMAGDQDEAELDTIIKSKVDEGVRFVYGNCDEGLLNGSDVSVYKDDVSESDVNDVTGVYTFDIDAKIKDSSGNAECFRVLWAKLSSWPYAVRRMYEEGEDDAAYLGDEYCGATSEKPAIMKTVEVVGSGTNTSVHKVLRFYVSDDDADSEKVTVAYLKEKASAGSDSVSYNAKLYPAIVNYVSGLVAVTFGEKERAREFFEVAMRYMGVKEDSQR